MHSNKSTDITNKLFVSSKSSESNMKHSSNTGTSTKFHAFHNSKDIPLIKSESKKASTDDRLKINALKVLPRRISFVKSKSIVSTNKIDEAQYNELKSKLIQLNGVYDPQSGTTSSSSSSSARKGEGDSFPRERYAMSAKSKVRVIGDNGEWVWWWPKNAGARPVGAGLVNTGVTCFMNSTLQALTYTPPLASFLLSEESMKYHGQCGNGKFCGFCMIRNHVRTAFTTDKRYFLPKNVLINLKSKKEFEYIPKLFTLLS